MLLNKKMIKKIIVGALEEDQARHDITTLDFIPESITAQARIIAKEDGIICGVEIASEVFKTFDKKIVVSKQRKDGQKVFCGDTVLKIKGQARTLLSCERVALNFLSYLSGIATQTHKAVLAVRPYGIQILDTRKTTPLLRALDKYAVLSGNGKNHRLNLSDQYLVKDNHLAILKKTIGLGVLARRRKQVPFEIEVENIPELKKALALCPDIIMLDNFTPLEVKKSVRLLKKLFPHKEKRPFLELSGGIDLSNISRYAIKGVDFISLGALTHSIRALDLSLEIMCARL